MRHRSIARKSRILMLSSIVVVLIVLRFPRLANAQDPFEIRVEQYEQPTLGGLTFEEHLNYAQMGTVNAEGTVAPTNHQFHMSSELTAGINTHVSLGLMLLTAVVPGRGGLEYAGWRVLPHLYAPDSWHLPVRLGLTAEFSFQRAAFDESSSTVELRPIIEKSVGRAQFDVNPAFERSLSGSSEEDSWIFQPSFRFAYEVNPRFSPSFEYYGMTGSLARLLPLDKQVHQIYPGVSIRLAGSVQWDLGIGVGLTPAGNRLLYKTRIEFSFGRHTK